MNRGVLFLCVVLCSACDVDCPTAEQCQAGEQDHLMWGELHCPHGIPMQTIESDFDDVQVIGRESYAIGYSRDTKTALWACERLRPEDLDGSFRRSDSWWVDSGIDKMFRTSVSDYLKTGYDKGHLVPAADRTLTKRLMQETFYLSNAVPQNPNFNRGVWTRLENWVRTIVRKCGEVSVITGVTFYDGQEHQRKIGKNVWVPNEFYKIVVRGRKAIAVILTNTMYVGGSSWTSHVRSIDKAENNADINFMPMLGNQDEEWLERLPGTIKDMENCQD